MTTTESILCWNSSVWVLHCCITSLFMFVQHWHYLILEYFIKHALDFCKVRIKLSSKDSKASRIYFLITSHCIASYIHSEAIMLHIVIHSQHKTLICMLTQQGSLAVAQVVLSFLLSMLIYTIWCVRSTECNQVMSCINVGQSMMLLHSYSTWLIQWTQRCICSVYTSLNYKLSASCDLKKFFIWFTHIDTSIITTTVLFAPSWCFCFPMYVPSEHKQYWTTHNYDISPHFYIPAILQ